MSIFLFLKAFRGRYASPETYLPPYTMYNGCFSQGRRPDEIFHEFLRENIPQSLPKNPFAHIRLKNEEIAL